jgi:hypothetical protein
MLGARARRRAMVAVMGAMGAMLAGGSATAVAEGRRVEPGTDYVLVPPQPKHRRSGVSHVLYLNRCASGCVIDLTEDNADRDASTIPETAGPLSPFAAGDDAWNAVVECVRQTYAPYDIEVVTDAPPSGSDYIEVMVAGSPFEVGLDGQILGIAPLAVDCSTQANVVAFAFANNHQGDVLDICATTAHEAGHTYGLDHEFECKDPMTYLVGCGQKQFVNLEAPCGEFDGPRECRCSGPTQNSYKKLIRDVGPGVTPPPPGVAIQAPANGTIVPPGVTIFVLAEEPRVVIRLELWINGWRWADITGETTQNLFMFPLPAAVPDGVLDLEVRAFNDVGQMGTSSITVTKGLPCTSAATCAAGQDCDGGGRCVYPTPPGQLGDACERDLDCSTTRCLSDGMNRLCTQSCLTDFADACPDDFTCLPTESRTSGACWPEDLAGSSGGCCQTTDSGPVAPLVLSLGTLLVVVGRRGRGRRGKNRKSR